MRALTRKRRFQLGMQAFVCHRWFLHGVTQYGLRREVMVEYARKAGWRSGVFRV